MCQVQDKEETLGLFQEHKNKHSGHTDLKDRKMDAQSGKLASSFPSPEGSLQEKLDQSLVSSHP